MPHSWNRIAGKAALVAGSYAAIRAAIALSRRYNFENRLVVITGGSRGLGLVIARQLADEGAALVLCARDDEELAVAAEELRERASFVATYTSDLSDADDIAKLFARIRREIGSVDVLINNAGIINVGPLETMTVDDYQLAMASTSGRRFYASSTCCPICGVAARDALLISPRLAESSEFLTWSHIVQASSP